MQIVERGIKNIVVGANGYLGSHIAAFLPPDDTLLVSSRSGKTASGNTILTCDLIHEIPKYHIGRAVEHLYLVARPLTSDPKQLDRFYANLFRYTDQILQDAPQCNVHFFSTALVYKSDLDTELTIESELLPQTAYEIFKLQMEVKLQQLVKLHNSRLHIYRLPLLAGGIVSPEQKNYQLFYRWRENIRNGHYWQFRSDQDKRYGTSWVNMADLINWICRTHEINNPVNIWHPISGHITYFDFQRLVLKDLLPKPICSLQPPPNSFLYLKSNTDIPTTPFESVFIK